MTGQYINPYLVDDRGIWTIRARFADTPMGRPKIHTRSTGLKVNGKNKLKAETIMRDVAEQWERQVKERSPIDPRATFADCAESWLRMKEPLLRKGTYGCYEMYYNKYIKPKLGRIKIKDLTHQHIQEYFNSLSKKLSPATLRKHNVIIHGTLEKAVLDGVLTADVGNVLKMVQLPKKRKYEGKVLSEAQIKAVFEHLYEQKEPLPAAMTLGLCYGLRRSEMCGLRWDDIDFENGVLHIKNTVVTIVGGRDESEHTKTLASRRDIDMIDTTREYLEKLYERRKKQGMVSDKVVAYEDGRAANPEYVSRHAKSYMEKCGAPDMRLHDLRHTAATILVKRMPVIYVSAFLGHNQVSTTMDIYSHVLQNERHLASDMMGGFLQSVAVCSEKCSENAENQVKLELVQKKENPATRWAAGL